ncbi:hypothetical protein SAMN04488238_104331 [Roseicitreum antarcticum]|uniref:IclR helix-turn-helix domain-containing protein n=2 Tax=Roseicitreum antarcticum TaxID=564137 RepID=A0A1H2XW81_9RHOB|nr:hypothetical protein SAMN04488238_104331 [Roseicitreum antarcticum]
MGMERDLGLDVLNPVERDIICALAEIAEGCKTAVRTEQLCAHELLSAVPASSLHRALRGLLTRGWISHPEGRKAGLFMLVR